MRAPESSAGFRDRPHAGRVLAELVDELGLVDPVVLALPRGGVPVAAEVASRLQVGFDVFVARKIGAPYQPEYGVGAIAEDGEPVFESTALRRLGLAPSDLAATVRMERSELARRVTLYRAGRELPDLAGRDVVLIDDGLATGVTARAALTALRGRRPRRLVLAVPVCARATCGQMQQLADEVVCAQSPERFGAVGAFYADFSETTDDEVLDLLARAGAPSRV